MKVVLTISLNISCLFCFAQKQLDFGEIKGKSDYITVGHNDKKICNSPHQLEISLTRAWLLMGLYENVTLTFDGWKWSAVKLKDNWINGKTDTVILSPSTNYDTLFSALKSNNVFLLYDQDLLKLEGTVDDGTEYSLSYKAGKHCHSYKFQNPDVYKEMNENVTQLTNYINIAQLLFEDLHESNAANTGLIK